MVVLLALTLWSATRTATVIDPIEIPEELKRDGYTPAIISHMIIDQMDKILKKADIENSGPASYKASGASRVSVTGTNGATSTDIAIPGAGMSIGSTIAYAKQVLGFPDRHISGEIIGENKKYKLTLRSLGSPPFIQ